MAVSGPMKVFRYFGIEAPIRSNSENPGKSGKSSGPERPFRTPLARSPGLLRATLPLQGARSFDSFGPKNNIKPCLENVKGFFAIF